MSDQEEIKYQGKIIEVAQKTVDINGKKIVFEYARRSPGVRLLINTPKGDLLLTKEKRIEHIHIDFRLPGGKVFDTLTEYNAFLKTGKDIIEVAKKAAIKEAKEEVGIDIESEDISYFATSVCGATVIWDLFYFVVNKYKKLGNQELEDGENIESIELSKEEARKLCVSGEMKEERSAAILLRYLLT